MLNRNQMEKSQLKNVTAGALILIILACFLFRSELTAIFWSALGSSECAVAIVALPAIGFFVKCRKKEIFSAPVKASNWGLVVMILAILLYAGANWPFDFGYLRQIAIVPVLAGIILLSYGRSFLALFFPVLLIILLAIPISSRLYAGLIVVPETITLQSTAWLLDKLPGIDCSLKGTDILFSRSAEQGIVCLGESNRGVRLIMTYLLLGIFVIYSRKRSLARVLVSLTLAIPAAIAANFLRFFIIALLTAYFDIGQSSFIRHIGATVSLLAVYLFFVLICDTHINLFEDDEPVPELEEVPEVIHV